MNIEGTYKVQVEQTVRKLIEGDEISIDRMLRKYTNVGLAEIPKDPKREADIRKLIAEYEADELATTMRMEITPTHLKIRSIDGDGDYHIKSRNEVEKNKVHLVLEMPDNDGDLESEAILVDDRILAFVGENEMSGFVWERA